MSARFAFIAVVAVDALSLVSCALGAKAPIEEGHWDYVVDAPEAGRSILHVSATFHRAGTERLAVAAEGRSFIRDLEIVGAGGARPVTKSGDGFTDPSCVMHCEIRYTVDLDALAHACDGALDCGMRVGDTFVGPALVWLVHPSPRVDVPATLRIRARDATSVASGFFPVDNASLSYRFHSVNIDEGAFTAFGPMRRRTLDAPGKKAAIDLAITGNHGMTDDEIAKTIGEAAALTSRVTGTFPLAHVTMIVVPQEGERGVAFGKVLSLAGGSVGIALGTETRFADRHDDWVIVHELFHLGFPSFRGEGRWLGEGLATYYEPVLRARGGWVSAEDVWRQFALEMPRAEPRRGRAAALVSRDDPTSIYWGGATFALVADVRIRAATAGEKSLDDVIRGTLARGGDATRVFTVAEVMKLGDEITGTHVLGDLYERHAARGESFDLDALFDSLGIERASDGVLFHDDAPLAPIRRKITGN